jgi:hypothetical protein
MGQEAVSGLQIFPPLGTEMISGENMADGVLVLQSAEHAELSGMFFYGGHWIRVASGCIVDGSLSPEETVSMLLFGFKTVTWKWIRTYDRSTGAYFFPLSSLMLYKAFTMRPHVH